MRSNAIATDQPFELRLFGAFDVRIGGQPLPPLRYRKEQWLLALLSLRHDRDVSRDWLAATFWPDNDEEQALFYLRKALSNLRNVLGDEAVRLQSPTKRTVRLDLSDAFADFLVFDASVASPLASPDRDARLRNAIELYRGPLLQDCTEEWTIVEREARSQAYFSALETVAESALARGEAASASRWLRLALAAEPHRESAACGLMRALAESGDRAALRQVYQELRQRLHADLNTVPAPETEALYTRLSRQEARSALPDPAAVTAPSLRHLPVPLTDLIGRDQEIHELSGWLERRRLVTLLGSGGVGKTRLSIATAEVVLPRFPDGVWFVDLAPLTDGAYVAGTIANVLGLILGAGQSAEERLIEELTARSLLLVLDNCEHLVDACARVAADLLGSCASLRILATSRQALGVTGEQVYRVPSLALPSSEDLRESAGTMVLEKDPSWLMDFAGIRLFVQRATLSNPEFRLDRRNGPAVAEVCQKLDGIPLAIELAAARLRSLTVNEINGKLDQRFRLLTGGSRAVLPRQQTLRALTDWSYDLLSEAEKTLLCRVSVFASGWTLDMAEKVCVGQAAGEEPGTVEAWEVLDLLTSLTDKSLVLSAPWAIDGATHTTTRYRLLETVRQYGGERLLASGEAAQVQARHREFFVALAEGGADGLRGLDQAGWINRLEAEHDNFRAALDSCADEASRGAGDRAAEAAVSGLRLSRALWIFWWLRGYLTEGRGHLARALALRPLVEVRQINVAERTKLVSGALRGAGSLAARQSDYATSQAYYEESLQLSRQVGDVRGAAGTLHNLGRITSYSGNYAASQSLLTESLELFRQLNETHGVAHVQGYLAVVLCELGDYAAARSLTEESLALVQESDDKMAVANMMSQLGFIVARQGDMATAETLMPEALRRLREMGDKNGVAGTLISMSFVAIHRGDYAAAQSMYEESLRLTREIVDRRGTAHGLEGMAACAAGAGRARRAAIYLAAADVLRQSIGAPLPPSEREDVDAEIGKARLALGDEAFAAAWAYGAALSREQAVGMALGELVLN